MARTTIPATLLGAVLLAGCTLADDALFPSLTGEERRDEPAAARSATLQSASISVPANGQSAVAAPLPQLGQSSFEPTGVTPGTDTGTAVGSRVSRLREDLRRLQTAISQHNTNLQTLRASSVQDAQTYDSLLSAIQARLQVGTTPGNPILVRQWTDAQGVLDKIGTDIGRMTNLSTLVADDSALSAIILESTRATYGLTGAIDEDHRQLAILEDEVSRTAVLISRLLNELNEDVARQSNFVGRERSNLTALSVAVKNGELFGPSLSNRAFFATTSAPGPGVAAAPAAARAAVPTSRPLVVVRFDRPNVEYENALFNAVSAALDRRPGSAFELVAVTPSRGTPAQVALGANDARRDSERVLRSLIAMGLPPERVNVSAASSTDAQTNEVHLYIR